MSTADAPAVPARTRRVNPLRRFLNRPEFGAIAGAILVFLVFLLLTGGKGFLEARGIAGDPFAALFNATLLSITIPGGGRADFRIEILWWIIIAGLATWVLLRTRFGNWIFGTGGSATAARNLGVPVARVKISLFMCTAASAALLAPLPGLR